MSPDNTIIAVRSPYDSLFEILRRRQGAGFIGRAPYIERFRKNLSFSINDPRRRFVFAVSGEPGVGKTWLMARLQRLANLEFGVCAVWDSGESEDPLAVMVHLAHQLAEMGVAMPQFTPAYHHYLQSMRTLAQNLDHSSGVRFFIANPLIDAPVSWQPRGSEWGLIPQPNLEDLYAQQVNARTFLGRQLLPDEETFQLIQDPIAHLTPLWLSDLRSAAQAEIIALFFDDIDRTEGWLEAWLHRVLSGEFGDVPAHTLWIMAQIAPLDHDRWLPLADLMEHFALKPFPQEDAQAFLHAYNGHRPDEDEPSTTLNLPLHLAIQATLRQELGEDPEDASPPIRQLIEGLPPEKARALLLAALPWNLTRERLSMLLGEPMDAAPLTEWLLSLPILQPLPQGWRIHELIRRELLRLGQELAPEAVQEGWQKLALALRRQADELQLAGVDRWHDLAWRELWFERLYYRLLQDERTYLGMAMDAALLLLEMHPHMVRPLARLLKRAHDDGAGDQLASWGERMEEAAAGFIAGEFARPLAFLNALIDSKQLEPYRLGVAHAFRAWLYRSQEDMETALTAYQQAAQADPELAWATGQHGATLFLMEAFDGARALLEQALEQDEGLDWAAALGGWLALRDNDLVKAHNYLTAALTLNTRQNDWAFAWRSEARRGLGKLDEALMDVAEALERYPRRAWLLALRGVILRELGRGEEALVALNEALALSPDTPWIIAQRGKVLEILGRNDDALDAYSQALALNPDDAWTLNQRGHLLLSLNRHEEALGDLDRVVSMTGDATPMLARAIAYQNLDRYDAALQDLETVVSHHPDDLDILRLRATSYLKLGAYDQAIRDLSRILSEHPQDVDLLIMRAQAYAGKDLLQEALADLRTAITLQPDNDQLLVQRGDIYRQLGRWEDALTDLNLVIERDPNHARAFALRGDVYRQMGEDEAAICDFARALALNPDDGWSLARRADVYRRMDRYQEALADFARALSLNPDDPWALARRAETYRQLGDLDLALADFTRSLELNPDDPWAWAGRGEVHFELDMLEQGVEDFTRTLELTPGDPLILERRGAALAELDRNQEALADFTAAMPAHPNQVALLTLRGDLLLKMRRFEESAADLNQALTLNPNYQPALVARGRLLRAQHRYRDALVDLDRAISLKPDDGWAMAYRGEVHRLIKRYQASLTDLTGALTMLPDEPWILAQRGETHRLLGMYGEALEDLSRALEQRPDDIWALATRGQVYRTQGQYDEALSDFTRAIELNPRYAWAYASRGETLRILKRYEDALEDLNKAIDLDPSMAWALVNRGQVHLSLRNPEAALEDFDMAVQMNPNYAWALAGRGQAYRMMGHLDAALDDFHQAIALNPNFVWALVNRGHVFRLMGQYQRALADFNRAISLDPNNAWAIAGRAQVNRALNRPEDVQNDLHRAIALTPELDEELFRRAMAHKIKGNIEAARTDLDEAIAIAQSIYDLDPTNWKNTFNLALYYLAHGRRNLAERLYREGLNRAPKSEIQAAERNLNDFHALFPDNKVAMAMLELFHD